MAERVGSRTRHKLGEAEYFLGRLKEMYGYALKFDYYLSAFISSARSVTWVMKSEYGSVPGYREWIDAKEPTKEQEELLGKITSLRNRTEKEGSVSTDPHYEVVVSHEDFRRLDGHTFLALFGPSEGCQLIFRSPSGEKVTCRAIVSNVNRTLEGFPEQHAVEVCEQYFALLKELVTECGERFDRGDTS